MRKPPDPLTVLERVKGFYIRDKHAAPSTRSTRDIMSTKTWDERNTRGNPKKPKK